MFEASYREGSKMVFKVFKTSEELEIFFRGKINIYTEFTCVKKVKPEREEEN